jgi:hypothetical protein
MDEDVPALRSHAADRNPAVIDGAERNLAPDVIRTRYEIDEDWSGQWAIFFRIVLTDEARRCEK